MLDDPTGGVGNAYRPARASSGLERENAQGTGFATRGGVNDRYEVVRRAQMRAAGGAFLRARPWVAWPAGFAQIAVLWASADVPRVQCALVTAGLTLTASAFTLEARALRARDPGERWLRVSLALTLAALTLGCVATGGLRSPQLPLLFAPMGVAFAAFGADPPARAQAALFAVSLAVLLVASYLGPFAPPPARTAVVLYGVSAVATAALLGLGIAGLVGAYRTAGAALDHLREEMLAAAEQRAADVEGLTARVAHELKNPLSAVKGLTQLLERESEGRTRTRLGVVHAEVERMESLLREYLSFARPLGESGGEIVSIGALFDDVGALLGPRAGERGVRVERIEESAGLAVRGDMRALRDALLNLARNGIDAMPAGGVLTLWASRDEGSANTVHLEVRDEGEGLADSVRERMGEPYLTTRPDGTGLGVALARAAVVRHGGRLTYRARSPRGTVATVALPAAVG